MSTIGYPRCKATYDAPDGKTRRCRRRIKTGQHCAICAIVRTGTGNHAGIGKPTKPKRRGPFGKALELAAIRSNPVVSIVHSGATTYVRPRRHNG